MSKPKDGQERRIQAEAVFEYVGADESVGIYGGWVFVGLQVGQRLIEAQLIEPDEIAAWAERAAGDLE